MLRKLGLVLTLVAFSTYANAQATFTAKDATGATQTFKSFNCTANICSLSVPADITGAAFGVTANPFFVVNSGTFAVQLSGATNNINNIAGTVSLPTGAATAAKQPAIGTAGVASVDILTVQGIASMTPLLATVTGTVAATQSGTWNITNISGTVSLPTGAATQTTLASIDTKTPALGQALAAASVPVILPSATITTLTPLSTVTANIGTAGTLALAANQTNATQKTQIVDGSGNVIAATSNNLNVQCANCSGSGVSTADAATFTAGASLFAGTGGFFQTTATSNPLTNGQQGMWQMTANRAGFVNLRNASGAELGVAAAPVQVSLANTAANATAVKVDGSAVTQPVSLTSTTITGTVAATQSGAWSLSANQSVNNAQINGVTPLMGNGPTGTGSQRVTISSDNTAFSVNAAATLAAETTKVIGTTRNVGNVGGVFDAIGQNVAAPANWLQMGCQFNTSPTTITSTNGSPCQLDNAGNLKVNIAAGASSGAVAQGSTTAGQTGGLTQAAVTTAAPSYTTAQTSPLSLNLSGGLRVDGSGVTQPVSLTSTTITGTVAATQSGTWNIGTVTTLPALPANQSVNTAQVNGVTTLTGTGAVGTGAQRISVGTDTATIAGSAPGTAGTASTNVVTVQGIAAMTPLFMASATAPVSTMNSSSSNAGINAANSAVFDDVSPTAITENSFGFLRMSANRNAYNTIRDAAGNERGVNVTAGNALLIDGSATTQPVSGTVTANIGTVGTLATAANQVTTQAPVAPATATATKSDLIGCQATTAAVNPTTGQQGAVSCDTNNNLLVSAGGAPNLLTAQVSVATSDTSVVAARALRRSVTIQQITGTQNVFCSNTTATTANGILLPAVIGASVTLNTTSAVRCIAVTGAQTVAVAETY